MTALRIATFATALAAAGAACGHGTPITIGIDAGRLRVSHEENGYAPFVFGQQGEESDPEGPLTLPGIGRSLFWGLPGIDIHGVDNSASLSVEVLLLDHLEFGSQTLWRWDPAAGDVTPTPAGGDLRILLSDLQQVALAAEDVMAPNSAVVANPLSGQTGFHNHSLMNFAMPYDGTQQSGLYGFFARFTSDSYEPSETFLAVFNLGVPYDQLTFASSAIWGAAFPGDYDRDGVVGTHDRTLWAGEYGSVTDWDRLGADGNGDGVVDAADYAVWRDNLPAAGISVPEPGAALLVLAAVVLTPGVRHGQRSIHPACTAAIAAHNRSTFAGVTPATLILPEPTM